LELEEVLLSRRSVRGFKSTEISEETVMKLLELANAAPSAGNVQGRDFVVVRSPETRSALAQAALGQEFVAEAPVVIVVCGNTVRSGRHYGNRGMELYHIQDADAAVQNLLLAVQNEGLGACWVGAFSEKAVCDILDLPDGIRPLAIIPIGVPKTKSDRTKPNRIKIQKLTHYERW
jgi:nitroreductase